METVRFEKEIPLYGEYDVAVFGGGPAGVCAAVEAARNGASVLLVESSGMLGGMATSALVGPFMTCYDRDGNKRIVGGLFSEIVEELKKEAGALDPADIPNASIYTSFCVRYHNHVTPFDSFTLQRVLDRLTAEAGVRVLCYTRLTDAIVNGGKIGSVILSALQGLIAVRAKVYIDATGNADLAVKAGVPTWFGSEDGAAPQPATLFFEVDNADDDAYERSGKRPNPTVKCYKLPAKGCYKVNHYRVFGVNASDSDSMTEGHRLGREQVMRSFRELRETPGFENCRISAVSPVLGVRESRHVKGDYRLTVKDITDGVIFPDAIALYGYGTDVHPRNENLVGKGNFKIETADVYSIPYRCLLPKNSENLLVAGKTVSGESNAAGAFRVMPCAMAIGQAAGCAAALSCRTGCTPREISVDSLRETLIAHGAIL